ncbi:hypothetical protein GGR56DRAFT_255306 [Xylariaceae sp. FL0804]|nr:hypothetical protein GGR56DRAFT_255306 [Xylariaceae sp. FL0804]
MTLKPIRVWLTPTIPNPWKVVLVLEELNVPYDILPILSLRRHQEAAFPQARSKWVRPCYQGSEQRCCLVGDGSQFTEAVRLWNLTWARLWSRVMYLRYLANQASRTIYRSG